MIIRPIIVLFMVAVFVYLLFKNVKNVSEDEDVSRLQKKISALETKSTKAKSLKQEIATTVSLEAIDRELVELRAKLKEAEGKS